MDQIFADAESRMEKAVEAVRREFAKISACQEIPTNRIALCGKWTLKCAVVIRFQFIERRHTPLLTGKPTGGIVNIEAAITR